MVMIIIIITVLDFIIATMFNVLVISFVAWIEVDKKKMTIMI